tara:strand:+ start:222 stop:521 length:300 start_codon:yes stop_codon:yes gene_type:complete
MKCAKCNREIEMIDGEDPDIYKYDGDGEFYNKMLCLDCIILVVIENAPQHQKDTVARITETENVDLKEVMHKAIQTAYQLSDKELEKIREANKWKEDLA